MIFHPILNELANIDLLAIRGVVKAEDQRIDGQTACFCPFCRQKRVGNAVGEIEKRNENGSDTPHFIIYNNERGGLYGEVQGNRASRAGAVRWMCTKTMRKGYGAIELYAAIHGLTLHGAGLFKACKDLALEVYSDAEQVRARYPELFGKMDYRTIADNKIDIFSFQLKTDFTPQELNVLGCEVSIQRGVYNFGFGGTETPATKDTEKVVTGWSTSDLNKDFRIYSISQCILPSVRRSVPVPVPVPVPVNVPVSVNAPATVPCDSSQGYQEVSEIIHGTPWNPLFVCFATEKMDCGCVFRPAMKTPPIVFSLTEEHSIAKVSKWLMGDKVFTYAMEHRDSASTAVHAAIEKLEPAEQFTDKRTEWVDSFDSKGNDIQKQTEVKIPLPEILAHNIIYCQSPQDAVSAYYTIRAFRENHLKNEELQSTCWYHTAFMLGRGQFWFIDHGEWKQSDVEFSTVQNNKLSRFAEKVILLFPNDMKSQRTACAIARRFRSAYLAMLPDSFRQKAHQRHQWLYGNRVSTIRDFVLTYVMFDDEAFLHDRDFGKLFTGIVSTARCAAPLDRKEKRDAKGFVKEIRYEVNTATVWTFMQCEGYFRTVEPDSEDKVGTYIQLDGPFVTPMTKESMVMFTIQCLEQYAAQLTALRPMYANEYELMLQGIARCKDVNERTISKLPAIELDYKGAYGPDHDHFFYQNGALRITKSEIRLVSYDDIDFNVDPRALLPWNFTMPRRAPFIISESAEYKARRADIETKAAEKDENGNPTYSQRQLGKLKSDLELWSRTYRWTIDWQNQQERDMWPALRVIRGFANIGWEMEEERIRNNQPNDNHDMALLNSHMANFLFALGRMLYLYHGKTPSAPYLMENSVRDNKRATGGSGKSTLVNIFAACSGKVLDIDCKTLEPGNMRFILEEFIPHVHRIVHWEDLQKNFSMKFLYNMVSSGMKPEKKHEGKKTQKLDDSPNHVVSSNYPLSDSDESTVGRFPLVPFSDRFARANPMTNKPARMISDLMQDFSSLGPEYLDARTRNQMAYINALAVQFLMRYNEIAYAPMDDVKQRQLTSELGEQTVRYFQYFFAQPAVYGEPQDLKSMFDEFVRDFTDSSDAKKDGYALRTFKEKCQSWCDYNGVTMNPPHLIVKKADVKTNYFHLQCWVTKGYFADKRWLSDPDRQPVFIRELERSDKVCYFYRQEDKVPADYEELYSSYKEFLKRPDPLPILDETDTPVSITEEQKAESVAGPSRRTVQPQPSSAVPAVPQIPEDEMPF